MSVQTQEKNAIYAIDPVHSSVEFSVRHLMISKVRGHFDKFEGAVELPPAGDLPTAVNVTIDAASINTREPQRDTHLKSADFLDAENHSSLTFASTRIEGDPDDFRVYGRLTLHGVTRDVVLRARFEGRGADPWGGQRAGYSAEAKIDRKDFGLVWNQLLEAGGVAVGDEVRIELNIEAVRQ